MTKKIELAHSSLRNMHPTLFKSLALKSAMLTLGGIGLASQGDYSPRQENLTFALFLPIEFWGVMFTLAGLLTAYGIIFSLNHYKYARYGLILGAAVTGIWAASYIVGFATGATSSYLGAIFYIYLSGTMMIWAGEPAFNPLSSALRQKDTNVKGNGKRDE